MKKLNHKEIESKWQKRWENEGLYAVDVRSAKKPFYNLMMFPYPSAEGLHVGNMYAFTGADIHGRYQRMKGFNVFEPIGLDGFGIHSENYAIKIGKHPKEHAKTSEENFYRQLSEIGNGFAWEHRLETYDPEYYKWTQWLFIQLYRKNLAYRGKALVNWCPSCKTVLADEQVISGKCERCDNEVNKKEMRSWYFKTTKYANRLLKNIEKIDWPEKIKIAQRNWIGRSEGAIIQFAIHGSQQKIEVFTTRPDTLYGATFMVVAPEYAKDNLVKFVTKGKKSKVTKYIDISLKTSKKNRIASSKEKTGVFTGLFVINPANSKKIPIYVADYVLMDYGTGAIMGVPAHDQRDWDFAKENNLNIVPVIECGDVEKQAFDEPGRIKNSGRWNGLRVPQDLKKIISDVQKRGWGKKATTYHLRDWLISRQRYWGPPIPMIYCDKCGEAPVPEKDLPVILPDIQDFKPKGDGTSPLSNAPDSWKYTKCPKCNGKAMRELDVSDTFLDSSWYFLRYPSIDSKQKPFDKKITKKWLPVDAYIGGAEHAVLHLLYARFISMALHDMGHLDFEEPFPFLYGHGLLIKDGAKISKSRGNIVVPDKYVEKFGSDAFRTYLMFLGPFDAGGDFCDTGIEGMRRFIEKVWKVFSINNSQLTIHNEKGLKTKMHQTIKKVTEDIEEFKYNTAIASIMEYVNLLKAQTQNSKLKTIKDKSDVRSPMSEAWHNALKTLAQLMAPFTPHLAEEAWQGVLGQKSSIHTSKWPQYDSKYIKEDTATIAVQVNGKLRATLELETQDSKLKEKVIEKAKENEKIKKWIEGKEIKKEIFVPGKLVNFVVNS